MRKPLEPLILETKTKEKKKISIGIYRKDIVFFVLKTIGVLYNKFSACKIVKNGQALGSFGEVKEKISENFKIFTKTYVGILDLELLLLNSNKFLYFS